MKVLQVQKYNDEAMIRYEKRCDQWQKEGGYNNNRNQFPQQAFYGLYTNQGAFRMTGYVAYDDRRALWGRTAKDAITNYQNTYGRL